MYTVTLTPDENGTVLVTCPDLPEVITFGEDEEDAIGRGADAIKEALAARIARREDIPDPSVASHWTILEKLAASFEARGDLLEALAASFGAFEGIPTRLGGCDR